MKNSRGLLLGIGLVLVLVFGSVFPILAQDSTATPDDSMMAESTEAPEMILFAVTDFFVNTPFTAVNIRSGPGTEYTILGKMRLGDTLDVTGRTEDSSWIRVNFSDQEAWVSEEVVVVVGDLSSAPVAEAGENAQLRDTASTGTTTEGDVVATAAFNVSLREQPTVNSARLGIIPFNTELNIEARSENNNWVRTTVEGVTGWVSANLLFFSQGDMSSLDVMMSDGSMMSADDFNAMSTAEATSDDMSMDESMTGTATPSP